LEHRHDVESLVSRNIGQRADNNLESVSTSSGRGFGIEIDPVTFEALSGELQKLARCAPYVQQDLTGGPGNRSIHAFIVDRISGMSDRPIRRVRVVVIQPR